jgi:hydroxypyruvate reductase
VHSGASIADINCVRKHFSAVKGGRLGRLAAGIPNLTILVSDVPAGRLDTLASGPTVPDSSTVPHCREIIDRYHLNAKFPPAVRAFFESPGLPETPKPDSFSARVVTLLSDADLAEAARRHAESLGFTAIVDNTCDDWDYRAAAAYLLAKLRDRRKISPPVCLISVGEVTVEVSRPSDSQGAAVGGRNQHFALYASTLPTPRDGRLAILSAGSDGIDGNSPSAGAVLDVELLQAGRQSVVDAPAMNFEAEAALARFDSGTFLNRIGATIETGPTGNNLRDLRLFLAT